MKRKKKIKLILAAMRYRSGPDLCNSVYMGGHETARLYHALGISYGMPGFKRKLLGADDATLDVMVGLCGGMIAYMKKHPMEKCPCCGQIKKVD